MCLIRGESIELNTIKVAMVYSSGNARLRGSRPIKTEYYFFRCAIFRNRSLEVEQLDSLDGIDVSKLEKDYDVVLIPSIDVATGLGLRGIRDCKIPVIARPHDPHNVLKRDMIGLSDSLKADWFFDFYPPAAFYEYYPKRFKYDVVHIGLEPSLYTSEIPWAERITDRIAVSGMIDKKLDLVRMLYHKVYLRTPKVKLPGFQYKLRTKCLRLPYVVHTQDVYPGQSTDQLHMVLSMFRIAIAATTAYPTVKYKETPAAGCLTFMESTERNHGVSHLGFENGKNAVFINESNYLEKFQEYLDSQDDPKWKKIAQEGRRHALENLSNDKGVEKLVHIMRKALGEENAEI